jgi:hypothetical protein
MASTEPAAGQGHRFDRHANAGRTCKTSLLQITTAPTVLFVTEFRANEAHSIIEWNV